MTYTSRLFLIAIQPLNIVFLTFTKKRHRITPVSIFSQNRVLLAYEHLL